MVIRLPAALWALACVLWLAAPGAAHAAPRAELRAATDRLVVGQTLELALVVYEATPDGIPDIPVSDGLSLSYRGMGRTYRIVNGVARQAVQLSFAMTAEAPGRHRIGPVRVPISGGNPLSAPAVALTVEAAPPDPGRSSAPLTIEHGFDTDVAWQGQVVVWHEALAARVQTAGHRWVDRPSRGLLPPKDAQPEVRSYTLDDPAGPVRREDRWFPLVATEVGTFDYPPVAVEVEVMVDDGQAGGLLGFFKRTRREVLRGDGARLEVRALPPAPGPWSGLVGRFTVASRIEQREALVGQSVAWRIDLQGDGTLEGFSLPPLDVDGARVYDAAPNSRGTMRAGSWLAATTLVREVVPVEPGTLVLPDLPIVVFDPYAGTYTTLVARGETLTVTEGEAPDAGLRSFSATPGALPDAEPPAPPSLRPLAAAGPGLVLPWTAWLPLAWLLAALPALVTAAAAARDQARAWAHARREARHVAPASPSDRLRDLPGDPTARLAALDHALHDAAAPGVPPALAEALHAVRADLDACRFAGRAEPADLVDRVRQLVQALDARRPR